jgi:pimeloyl-ACP methyl ester carboxylesterase
MNKIEPKNYIKKFIKINPYTNWLKLQHIPEHSLSYLEFGNPNNQNVIICAHGLTRNAYDFVKIGCSLSSDFRIISISYPGRGDSDYFKNKEHYNYQVYMQDTLLVMELLGIHNPIWLGTSMGGIIGMALASKYTDIFKAMILNDIGPFMPAEILLKIVKYAAQIAKFDDLISAKQHLKIIYSQFGITDEKDWDHLVKHSFTLGKDGKYVMNYDPMIVHGVEIDPTKVKDVDIWSIWNKIKCPLLVIHGALSNILQKSTLEQMRKTRNFDLYTIDYAGHAPALTTKDQISAISSWLKKLSVSS